MKTQKMRPSFLLPCLLTLERSDFLIQLSLGKTEVDHSLFNSFTETSNFCLDHLNALVSLSLGTAKNQSMIDYYKKVQL